MSKKIILLAGPTASGKSKLAIHLAKKLKGEIIARGKFDAVRLIYLAPNFKIQIGSFPDIGSAQRALVEWRILYPDAFVVKTQVPWYPIELPQDVPADTVKVDDVNSPE